MKSLGALRQFLRLRNLIPANAKGMLVRRLKDSLRAPQDVPRVKYKQGPQYTARYIESTEIY